MFLQTGDSIKKMNNIMDRIATSVCTAKSDSVLFGGLLLFVMKVNGFSNEQRGMILKAINNPIYKDSFVAIWSNLEHEKKTDDEKWLTQETEKSLINDYIIYFILLIFSLFLLISRNQERCRFHKDNLRHLS